MLPAQTFAAMRTAGLPLAIEIDSEKYLAQRIELLHAEFQRVDRLAQTNELPEASVTKGVLKITPLDNQESEEVELLTRQAYGLMPRIKITDLLTEVDSWCDFGGTSSGPSHPQRDRLADLQQRIRRFASDTLAATGTSDYAPQKALRCTVADLSLTVRLSGHQAGECARLAAPRGRRRLVVNCDTGENNRPAVGKLGDQRQAAAHGLDGLSQGREQQIAALFEA